MFLLCHIVVCGELVSISHNVRCIRETAPRIKYLQAVVDLGVSFASVVGYVFSSDHNVEDESSAINH